MEIIYEDNHILVCYKPKGVLSQADSSDKEDMLTILKKYIMTIHLEEKRNHIQLKIGWKIHIK